MFVAATVFFSVSDAMAKYINRSPSYEIPVPEDNSLWEILAKHFVEVELFAIWITLMAIAVVLIFRKK